LIHGCGTGKYTYKHRIIATPLKKPFLPNQRQDLQKIEIPRPHALIGSHLGLKRKRIFSFLRKAKIMRKNEVILRNFVSRKFLPQF
jgi:hypothetical protein